MNDGLKQRLIGAIVLLAIAVIFIPTLFDRQTLEPVDSHSQIPRMPEVIMAPIVVAEPPVVESPAPAPAQMLIPSEEAPASREPEPPSLNNNGVPKGWVLQLVSYTEEPKANQLRDQLIADKYPAYVRFADTPKGRFYRVYVGPKLDKNKLLSEQQTLDARYKVKSILLDITPSE
jgi:DedD protein